MRVSSHELSWDVLDCGVHTRGSTKMMTIAKDPGFLDLPWAVWAFAHAFAATGASLCPGTTWALPSIRGRTWAPNRLIKVIVTKIRMMMMMMMITIRLLLTNIKCWIVTANHYHLFLLWAPSTLASSSRWTSCIHKWWHAIVIIIGTILTATEDVERPEQQS